jgi:hypothetical protein
MRSDQIPWFAKRVREESSPEKPMAAFELSKWYADCVSEQGDLAILYHAELRLGGLPVHYESLLLKDCSSPARALYSLRRGCPPSIEGGRIRWQSPQWQAQGSWKNLGAAHHEVLFESSSGSLEWNCLAPRAAASMQIGSGEPSEGWGYAECLRLSVPPWRLPIRRLRWGRFVNATDALVWIDWSGPYNKRVVFLNGSLASAESINDDEVVLEGEKATLHLEDRQVIRDGTLGATALSAFPGLSNLFPASVLNMRECKWLSKAVLRRRDYPDSTGMAIHEVVEWP